MNIYYLLASSKADDLFNFRGNFLKFYFGICELAFILYLINEIQPKRKCQYTVQCPFKQQITFLMISFSYMYKLLKHIKAKVEGK